MNMMDILMVSGFFSDLGEALFGTKTKKQGQQLAAQAANATSAVGQQAGQIGQQAGQQGAAYDKATAASMGGSAQEYMQKANQAAQGQAEQAAQQAATSGTQAALRAARSSGLSKGQAALTSGQQAGDIYSQNYQQGLESGRGQYMSATGQLANQGSSMAQRQQAALGTQLGAATGQANIGQQQIANAQQTASNTWGTIGTIAGGVAGLLSDENAKQNIQEADGDAVEKKKKFDIDALGGILEKSLGTPSSQVNVPSQSTSPSESFAAGANAGTKVGSMMSNNNLRDSIGSSIGSIIGAIGSKISDEQAKEGVEEVPQEAPKEEQKKKKNADLGAAVGEASGSSFGKGFSQGTKIGKTLSDENAKNFYDESKNSLDSINIHDIAEKIRPVRFEYKKEIINEGKAEPGEHVGVIAQDLEKTPLASAVKEGEDGLKRIDTAELSTANLNLIIQLANEVKNLREKVEGK